MPLIYLKKCCGAVGISKDCRRRFAKMMPALSADDCLEAENVMTPKICLKSALRMHLKIKWLRGRDLAQTLSLTKP
jgi:hypothetical protein